MSDFLIGIPIALLGLIVGSFINVVAYRVPLQRSVVSPGSACPRCDHPLEWRDNVPVVSWVLLAGKCRHCGARISPRYPIVEVATAALFFLTFQVFGLIAVLPAQLWFVGVTIALTLTDLDHKKIPNRILFPSTAIGVVLLGIGALIDGQLGDYGRAILGGLIYFAALFLLALVARGGFGFGDVKLAAFLGLYATYLGWGQLVVAMVLPFVVGGVASILLLVTRIKGRKDAIPFGPYMVAGAYIAVFAGQAVVDWYLR
ncbi:MAG: prepilin peptidase [Acidimicrobiia bacterium]|nr:prepilin peptidase [Acidimicrobiia bacterium]